MTLAETLVIFGGQDDLATHNDFLIYDTVANNWGACPPRGIAPGYLIAIPIFDFVQPPLLPYNG